MSSKVDYRCDVCGHAICEGHQEYYMATVTIDWNAPIDDGSCAGTERQIDTYHVHNDFSNHCLGKIWGKLEKDRK